MIRKAMCALLLSPEQLAGVYEKLKRAEESIVDLNSMIGGFLREGPKGGFSHDKQKAAQEFAEFHAKRAVPLRFGVIAGEVIHHLRSSLEHIAWMLSADSCRREYPAGIGFPLVEVKPATKDEITRYDRQVKGILNKDALALIERLQPYNAPNPAADPLAVLHSLSNDDKHHTLILIVAPWKGIFTIPRSLLRSVAIIGLDTNKEWLDPAMAAQPKLELTPYVAFAQIGGRKDQAVIPALTHLLNTVRDDVRMFSELTI